MQFSSMESEALSSQIAKSTTVLYDRQDFFSLDNSYNGTLQIDTTSAEGSCMTSTSTQVTEEHTKNRNHGKRISTLTFDPSKTYKSKSFIKEEVQGSAHEDFSSGDAIQTLFWCALCNETFNCQFSLEDHMKSHTVKSEHTYSGDDSVQVSTDNRGKSFKCSVCDKMFYTKFKLCDHVKIHTGETPFHCPWCEKRFTHGRNLHKHVISAHQGDDVSVASLLAKALQSQNNSDNRLVVYTGEGTKPYKCALCSKTFRRLYRVKEHTRTHSGQKPFQCSVCGKSFNSSDILYRHVKKIHKESGASLPKTDPKQEANIIETDIENQTIIRIEGASGIPVHEIQQAMCDIQFLNASRTDQNSNILSYLIDLSSAGEAQLELHQDVTNEAPHAVQFELRQEVTNEAFHFQCSQCGKTFVNSSLLNKHVDTHKIQLSTKCSICYKTFKAESYLRRHMVLHSGEKPFKCSFCPKSYFRQYRLSNHLRTHTGEKPYQCYVCGKAFAVSDNFKRHVKKMHKGEGLQCATDMVKQVQEMNREKKHHG